MSNPLKVALGVWIYALAASAVGFVFGSDFGFALAISGALAALAYTMARNMSDWQPAEVFSLAQFVAEEMQARGWRSVDVACRMGEAEADIPLATLCVEMLLAVEDDDLTVGDDIFAGLSRAFGVSEHFFRNIDAFWRKWPDRRVAFVAPDSLFCGEFK